MRIVEPVPEIDVEPHSRVWGAAILPNVDSVLASLHPVRPIGGRRFTRRTGLHPVKDAVCMRRASPRPDRVHERV